MRTRYEAFVDKIPLSSIASEIYILDIQEKEAKVSIDTGQNVWSDGLFVMRKQRESLSVILKVAIRAYSPERRQAVLEAMHLWANGEYLSLSTRPLKRLRVTVDAMPTVQSALKWTDAIQITFIAREEPFWEDEEETACLLVGESGSCSMIPVGTVNKSMLCFEVENTGGDTLDTLSVSTGGKTMSFSNLGVSSGESVSMRYENGVQILPVEKRTPESADDLFVLSNKANVISFSANCSVKIKFYTRGRYY